MVLDSIRVLPVLPPVFNHPDQSHQQQHPQLKLWWDWFKSWQVEKHDDGTRREWARRQMHPRNVFQQLWCVLGMQVSKKVPCEKLCLFLFFLRAQYALQRNWFPDPIQVENEKKKFKLCNISFLRPWVPSSINLQPGTFLLSIVERNGRVLAEWGGSGVDGQRHALS